MTSRQRFLASLTGGALDRFFRYEHGPWPTTRERWIAEGYPPTAQFAAHFGLDPLARIAINSGYCDSPYQPKFVPTVLREEEHTRVIVDADGITKVEFTRQGDTSMPQFLHFPVRSRAEWRVVRRRLNPADAAARIGDPQRVIAACADPDVPTLLPICGAYGHPRNLLGDEGLAYMLYDEPALIDEILANWRDLYLELLRELTRHVRVDCLLIWEDMCYKNGPLLGPEQFRRFLLPRYREVIEAARRCGIPAVMVDTDGDCLKLLPLFLEAGADCLMPFEVAAGMDVVAIGREYPALSIMGGIDKRALSRDAAAIRREVDRVLPYFVERGRYIPTLDHTVPPDVPFANFQYYLECVRAYESPRKVTLPR